MFRLFSILFVFVITFTSSIRSQDTIFVAFWNLENLFDTIDDPEKNDEQFLPDGEKEWNNDRFNKKLYNLARVIRSMNNGNGPDILGVCEVENKNVIDSLIIKFLPDLNYKSALIESPDKRGIDNGLIYKADKFKLLNLQADTVHLSDGWPTRLIFGTNLLTNDTKEKITVFVNHWPSRSGGREESEPNRIAAAKPLRAAVDRILNKDSNAKIFIIGDFNDDPTNESLITHLKAQPLLCDSLNANNSIEDLSTDLFNLSYQSYTNGLGSYKYKEFWNMLDQIIVSGSLVTDHNFSYICNSFNVYKPEYIVTQSGNYEGAPFPTYGGPRYLGGYSDHYPVTATFFKMRSAK